MIEKKEDLIKILLNTKDNIKEFNNTIQLKRKELPDIKRIKRDLTQIEEILKSINKICKKEDED